ncbi:hypothetical protein Rhopal_001178-T1 [Rhodotorula paludigena]|uniref:GPI-anchored wall transfer protein n=1 Tax=Rhodotorula paludigena TaxID=86838 RepID=A0AAV5GDL3_9BASI|nr:hypothetical protein Rhopal_001178-T1 [Rhodotorula paludigena]
MGYNDDKVAFVSGSHGGPTSYALWTVAHERILARAPPDSLKVPLVEALVLLVPLLLALTVFSAHPLILNAFIAVVTFLWARSAPVRSMSPPLSPTIDKKKHTRQPSQIDVRPFSRPFVSSYRAIMMVMTVLCILAVDFPVFPREFAKAETWGTSLMDLGVGSFVFSLGLVAALPLLRGSTSGTAPPASPASYFASILRSFRKSLPLIALGGVRVIMVKGVDYPEHVTEYGVHWNFFFTLALLPVFGEAISRLAIAHRVDLHVAGLGVAALHQAVLSWAGLQRWALEAERVSLISQNKEGLASFPGYLAIYLLGLATGLYVLPPSPSFFTHQHASLPSSATASEKQRAELKRQKAWVARPGKLAEWLGSAAVLWWAAFGGARAASEGVSRRLANLPYVLWVAAFNTLFLFLYLAVHLHVASASSARPGSRGPEAGTRAPALFEAINRNGLVVFLAANLLTGLVNVSIQSMYTSDTLAVLILVLYTGAIVGVAWGLRKRRIKLG